MRGVGVQQHRVGPETVSPEGSSKAGTPTAGEGRPDDPGLDDR